MPNKCVEYHLSTRSPTPLSWSMRLKVAQDTARGLAYLHEGMDFQVLFFYSKKKIIIIILWPFLLKIPDVVKFLHVFW
ncbi:putative non-specific serine/threonine protein kinase [Helianthus annuus]|nr:putative non-specific serine/threonine protein kinase [Helianthus annuus]